MPIDIFVTPPDFEMNASANSKLTYWFIQVSFMKNGQDSITGPVKFKWWPIPDELKKKKKTCNVLPNVGFLPLWGWLKGGHFPRDPGGAV